MRASGGLGADMAGVDTPEREVPAAGGGAKPFRALVRAGGRASLPAPRRPMVLSEPIRVGTESRWLEVRPADSLRVSYTLDNSHPIIGLQAGTYQITEDAFPPELAPAPPDRFPPAVPPLRQNGLARGGPPENAAAVCERDPLSRS